MFIYLIPPVVRSFVGRDLSFACASTTTFVDKWTKWRAEKEENDVRPDLKMLLFQFNSLAGYTHIQWLWLMR